MRVNIVATFSLIFISAFGCKANSKNSPEEPPTSIQQRNQNPGDVPTPENEFFKPNGLSWKNKDWQIEGYAPLKMVPTQQNFLAVLAEKHELSEGGSYLFDQPREVLLLHSDGTNTRLDRSVIDDNLKVSHYYLTDIARDSQRGNGFWLSATQATARNFKHFIFKVDITEGKVTISHVTKSEQNFPELSPEDSEPFALTYQPSWDTSDVSRVISWRNQVALVARTSTGVPYTERFEIQEKNLLSLSVTPVSASLRAIRKGMTSGSFDVLKQLSNPYLIFGSFREDGTIVVASLSSFWEREERADYFEQQLEIYGREPAEGERTVNVYQVDSSGELVKAQAVAFSSDSLFLSLEVTSDRIYLGGMARFYANGEQGRSRSHYIELGEKAEYINFMEGSSVIQAMGFVPEHGLYFGGSRNWRQNPAGLSISGGRLFVAKINGELVEEISLPVNSVRRSEVRQIKYLSDSVVCFLGMNNGPGTHSADRDASKLVADGFLFCRQISA
ncbi:hypothetical protein [Pseudobacteriovorax antillogorgiicola]|uniref:Uncharacterized protein n=2 Tax=Pseudobacteriovorax antillogorgiicola TaxID=1513793 RepID=A0A1Y6CSB9_9BACT|nr:hypothetical protein [Pseudobacteriovorax antillogorgiicola]TCS45642.1 hypothetical protein EDD56_12734 [Pseudobacteriovorax antillogorgiicola]SMF72795.1 hypothetical protein SAMN06296036_12733 [Pseudobacteriovorax antillogorgiicola]